MTTLGPIDPPHELAAWLDHWVGELRRLLERDDLDRVDLWQLHAAGVEDRDLLVAADVWGRAYRVHDGWGLVRAVSLNEAARRLRARLEVSGSEPSP